MQWRAIGLLAALVAVDARSPLLGGLEDTEKDSSYFNELANLAVRRYNQESNNFFIFKGMQVVDIHKSQRQVVRGERLLLDLHIAKTNCTKHMTGVDVNSADCVEQDDHLMCVAELSRSPGEENFEMSRVHSCEKTDPHQHTGSQDGLATEQNGRVKLSRSVKPKDYHAWMRFSDFVDKYDKTYDSKRDTLRRFRVFKRNLRAIKTWQKNEKGTAVYGETIFSDLTPAEFRKIYLPYQWGKPVTPNKMVDMGVLNDDPLPASFDWRGKGAVTPVKNQGQCGSCWAFSTTGNIEGAWFLAKKQLVSLSEQELVDCDSLDQGCNGGLPSNAYKEIIRMGGLEPENEYPYEAEGETCHLVKKDIAVYINDSVQLPEGDEVAMQKWLVEKGPISIG